MAYEKTKHISGELNTMGVKQVLSPCIDVVRDLRWGRVEESFGEDPFLCSRMAVAEVKGYLDHGISPMLKHYGPHGNPVGGLNLASVDCGIRDLFDIYMKPFETVIAETKIMAVMSSYDSWNRIPNSASRFMLTDILRNKLGFRGYVYSDWGVVSMLRYFHKTAANDFEAASQVLTAGLDVEASSSCFPALAEKVQQGEFDLNYINQAVKRVLRAKIESGLFEDPYQERVVYRLPLRSEESVRLSRQIADESAVLLKNEGQLLPLDASRLKSIAVIGPNADQVQFGDYTWSKKKEDGVTPLQGIRRLLDGKVKINYAKGCALASLDTSGIDEAVEAARKSDVALVFVGSSSTSFVRHSAEPSTSGEGMGYDLLCSGLMDLEGNKIPESSTEIRLEYEEEPDVPEEPEVPDTPSFPAGSIRINEVMADPKGQKAFPETEYVELYNTTDKAIELNGWSFLYGSKPTVLTALLLDADGYVVLYRSGRDIHNFSYWLL